MSTLLLYNMGHGLAVNVCRSLLDLMTSQPVFFTCVVLNSHRYTCMYIRIIIHVHVYVPLMHAELVYIPVVALTKDLTERHSATSYALNVYMPDLITNECFYSN